MPRPSSRPTSRAPVPAPSSDALCEQAVRVRAYSIEDWGDDRAVNMVGCSAVFHELLEKLEKIARADAPVLITGESGVGKESIAQSIYLLSDLRGGPFTIVNCPRRLDDSLMVSELFGHRKGSFTGAVGDKKGKFELAEGGVMFLDEIGDLPGDTQTLLLRAMNDGEYQPIGADEPLRADVRVVAATNRPLNQMVAAQKFRNDLYFRLKYFQVPVPPLRAREDDWRLLLEHFLQRMIARHKIVKRFSEASLKLLGGYDWPGNVRQLLGVVESAYVLSDEDRIDPEDFRDHLEESEATGDGTDSIYRAVVSGGESFWDRVHAPFMDRDLNRLQVQAIVKRGLAAAGGSYQDLVDLLQLPKSDYQKFMDFLRHHRLKP